MDHHGQWVILCHKHLHRIHPLCEFFDFHCFGLYVNRIAAGDHGDYLLVIASVLLNKRHCLTRVLNLCLLGVPSLQTTYFDN